MKLCVFGDIHGNGPAFRAAYRKILAEQAEFNIFLGDLCGYYYDQLDILNMLLEIPNLIGVLGNHDRIFLDITKGNRKLLECYHQEYGLSMDNLLKMECGDLMAWLASLPEHYKDPERRFSCFHGSPQNPLEGYVYPDSEIQFYPESPETLLFLGHTHYKMYRSTNGIAVINPGSLGQPRDGGWPSYVVVDLPSREVLFRDVMYDKDDLRCKVKKVGDENRYLRDVLDRKHE